MVVNREQTGVETCHQGPSGLVSATVAMPTRATVAVQPHTDRCESRQQIAASDGKLAR